MALIKCSECGKEISDKATTCIHCGNPISKNKSNIIIGIVGVVIFLYGIIAPMYFIVGTFNINAGILRIPLVLVGFILIIISILKKPKKTNRDEKTLNKISLIIIGINIITTLISMIFVLTKISSNFYKAVIPVYLGIVFINVIILPLIIKRKIKQESIKLVNIGLLVISLSTIFFYSMYMISKYNDYVEEHDKQIDNMLNQYNCETKYDGYWSSSSGTCYYNGGSTRTP